MEEAKVREDIENNSSQQVVDDFVSTEEFSLAQEKLKELIASVYPELRRIALAKLRGERRNHTLQATALTNEVVLRLLRRELAGEDAQQLIWSGVQEMRRILIDHGRKWQLRNKHLDSVRLSASSLNAKLLSMGNELHLQMLLDQLETLDPRARQVVELRFFVGLTGQETADFMSLSVRTVAEDWEFARSWLARHWRD